MKLILILIAFAVVYWIIKSYKKKLDARGRGNAPAAGEDMVRCAQCGVHLPRSESLMSGELFYCTPDHRRLHQRKSS
ncbi:MAG: PP0621 family protein [Burkholderiales bacterium]